MAAGMLPGFMETPGVGELALNPASYGTGSGLVGGLYGPDTE